MAAAAVVVSSEDALRRPHRQHRKRAGSAPREAHARQKGVHRVHHRQAAARRFRTGPL